MSLQMLDGMKDRQACHKREMDRLQDVTALGCRGVGGVQGSREVLGVPEVCYKGAATDPCSLAMSNTW